MYTPAFKKVLCIFVVLCFPLCIAQCTKNPVKQDTPVAEKTQLEGDWINGTDGDGKNRDYSFSTNTVIVKSDGVELYNGTFTLDTISDPAKITILVVKSKQATDQGKTIPALYKLSANILTITGNVAGSARPDAMDASIVPIIKLTLQEK